EESPAATVKVPAQIPVTFVDVTKEAGLTPEPFPLSDAPPAAWSGACFLDYDNDGKIDLFLPENGSWGMTLYHNVGNGKFENVTRRSGLDQFAHGVACTTGDNDDYGFNDMPVADGTDDQVH